jgi:hypothetical protein
MIISGSSYLLNYVSGKFIELPSNQIVLGDRNYLYAETGIAIGKFNFNSGKIPTGINDFFAPSAAIGYANDIQNVNENFILGFANSSYDGNSKYIIGRLNYLGSGDNVYVIGASNSLEGSSSIEIFGTSNFIQNGVANYSVGDFNNISGGVSVVNLGNSNVLQSGNAISLIGLANTSIKGISNNIFGIGNYGENTSNLNLIGNTNSASNSNTSLLFGVSNLSNSGDFTLIIGSNNSSIASTVPGGQSFVNVVNAGAEYINTRYYPIDTSTGIQAVYSVDPLNPFGSSTIYNDTSKWNIYSENDGQDVYYSIGQSYNPWQATGWNFYDPAWSGAPIQGDVTLESEEIIDGNVGPNNIVIGNSNFNLNSTNSLILGNANLNSNLNNKIIGDLNSNNFSGFNNFLVGNNNILNEEVTGNYLVGNSNLIKNVNKSYIGGNSQSIYNISDSILLGNSSLISGNNLSNQFLNVGNYNILYGNNNISVGNTNLVLGSSNSAFGTSNTIGTGAQSCLVFGRNQNLTGLNEVGKIRLGTSSSTNLSIKLDNVEITSILEPTINDQKIITSAHTGELVSLNKLASFEYLPLSGQTFTQLNIVDNEFDHLADQINLINGGLNVSHISYYSPNSGYSGLKNGTIFRSTSNFYKTPVSAYQGIYSVSGSYFYNNSNDSLDIIYTTSLTPSRWMISNSTGAGFYFYNNGDGNFVPISNWVRTGSNISNSGFNPPPNFSTGIVTSSVNQRYKLTNNFSNNFNPTYVSALTNYYLSEDNYFSLIYGNNTSGNLFPIANSASGLRLANQWMIVETIDSGFYHFIDTTGSNGTTVPYTGFVSTGQNLLTTGQGTSPNPEMTLQIGSRTGIIGSFHPDYGRIYVPFYF